MITTSMQTTMIGITRAVIHPKSWCRSAHPEVGASEKALAGQYAAQFWHMSIPLLIVQNQRLNHRIVGTVIAKASVETRSIEAASDSTALYRDANSTTTVARGKLQHTSASRANGLTTCKRCSRANRTADCTVTRASEPANTALERRTG